jgi:hypothetical protein
MMESIKEMHKALREEAYNLYMDYKNDKLTLEEYLEKIRPIDDAVDKIEMAILDDFINCNHPLGKSVAKDS